MLAHPLLRNSDAKQLLYEGKGKSITSRDTLSVEKSFNWNYSFITEKREALQKSVQEKVVYSIEIITDLFFKQTRACGRLFMAVQWSIVKVNDYPPLEKHQMRSELLRTKHSRDVFQNESNNRVFHADGPVTRAGVLVSKTHTGITYCNVSLKLFFSSLALTWEIHTSMFWCLLCMFFINDSKTCYLLSKHTAYKQNIQSCWAENQRQKWHVANTAYMYTSIDTKTRQSWMKSVFVSVYRLHAASHTHLTNKN